MGPARVEIEEFIQIAGTVEDIGDLARSLERMTSLLGFVHFAVTQHTDSPVADEAMIRLHNYPKQWVDYFDANRLGLSDPVHRASQRIVAGFRWERLPHLIELTPADRKLLMRARDFGLANGFTVPAHIVGEATGSCTFALGARGAFPTNALVEAQMVGLAAFDAARRIWLGGMNMPGHHRPLTDRQRDCLIWTARGKTAWETASILGIREVTVIKHLTDALNRYGVQKRTSLLIRTLFDGTISFADIFRR
ncbi:LuxR family transcriptional regulator [Sphingomonas sp. 66-10]|uniref:helix-turn-helix transcriptional regulator n=1 Tax=Sphingomonas sp. 66-10 TaxID=1895848 RepID=UPI00257ABC8B|nr:LuxR family transcriptional regulator [Sphingomonas sp. 66-10]